MKPDVSGPTFLQLEGYYYRPTGDTWNILPSLFVCILLYSHSFIYYIFSYFLLLVSHRRCRYSKIMSYHILDKPCFNYGIATFITTCMIYRKVEDVLVPDFLRYSTT